MQEKNVPIARFKIPRPAIVLMLTVALLLLVLFPFDQERIYQLVYLSAGLLLLIGLIGIISARDAVHGYCNPLSVVTVVYIAVFSLCPLYDILNQEYDWFGYNFFEYGFSATLIAIVGYLFFAFVYLFSYSKKDLIRSDSGDDWVSSSRAFSLVLGAMYLVSFSASAFYMVKSSGNSLLYCFSLGLLGESGLEASNMSLGAISMFSYCLPAITLCYCEYGNSRILKAVALYLLFVLQIARGFRFIVVQIILMFLLYYRYKHRKLPNISFLILIGFFLISALLFMTMFRDTVRAGLGADLSSLSLESLKDSFDAMFWDNLRIYKNYYGMVGAIPKTVPHAYLSVMVVGTLIMFIPRALWAGKPVKLGAGVDEILGSGFRGTGQAYPNLGEYWYAFGFPSVITFMSLYGWWMKKSLYKYGGNRSAIDNMILAVTISLNLQLIIRGYTPSNFWLVVFSIAPLVLLKPLCALFDSKQ